VRASAALVRPCAATVQACAARVQASAPMVRPCAALVRPCAAAVRHSAATVQACAARVQASAALVRPCGRWGGLIAATAWGTPKDRAVSFWVGVFSRRRTKKNGGQRDFCAFWAALVIKEDHP